MQKLVQYQPFLNIWYSFLQGGGGKVSHSNGDVIIPDEGLTIVRIFETHGYWALISNTELSFVPRGFLFIRIRKKHRKIMEQSCHKNNTILFKNAHYYARWYSIYMSKNKQYPNFTTFSHFQQKNYQLYSESDCLLIELLSYSKCEAPFFFHNMNIDLQ